MSNDTLQPVAYLLCKRRIGDKVSQTLTFFLLMNA